MNNEFLLQYDQPLDDWYKSCEQNEDYFIKDAQTENARKSVINALYVIHHFDTDKEGDTCRSQFCFKIRKILDERLFIAEVKQMWVDIKSGDIVVDGAWSLKKVFRARSIF